MATTPLAMSHPRATLCVANLSKTTSEADIRALFSRYGAVQRVKLFSAAAKGGSLGFCYLDLSSEEVANAVSGLNGKMLNGSSIRVSCISESPLALEVTKALADGEAPPQDDEVPSSLPRPRYQVVSVEKAEVPDGGQGSDWYCYVLQSGAARITGFHCGTLEEVTAYAASCAECFNMRSAGLKSPAAAVYTRKK